MFRLLNTTRRAVSTMTSSETTPFSVSYVTVPNDEVANKLAEYVYCKHYFCGLSDYI